MPIMSQLLKRFDVPLPLTLAAVLAALSVTADALQPAAYAAVVWMLGMTLVTVAIVLTYEAIRYHHARALAEERASALAGLRELHRAAATSTAAFVFRRTQARGIAFGADLHHHAVIAPTVVAVAALVLEATLRLHAAARGGDA